MIMASCNTDIKYDIPIIQSNYIKISRLTAFMVKINTLKSISVISGFIFQFLFLTLKIK
jgi:hypothetical protein